MIISEHIEKAMEKIEGWWNGELVGDRVCIGFWIPKPGKENVKEQDLNRFCPPLEEREPDFEKMVESKIKMLHSRLYFGEEIPRFFHEFGGRCVPIIMGAYLGGDLKFGHNTIWQVPSIDLWRNFEPKFDLENFWYLWSKKIVTLATEASKGEFIVDLPDFGDVLTSLFKLRGPYIFEEIGWEPKILQVRDEFFEVWTKYYGDFYQTISQKFPGSSHWLIWAPGKAYACQCDASCMVFGKAKEIVLKRIVEDFIIPEIEKLGKYLDYIIWHMDGHEQISYLDTLLELPQIKAIQWVPGMGNPPAAEWIWLLQKIQRAGKSVWVSANNEIEVKTLIENLLPQRLYIAGGFTGKGKREAKEFLNTVTCLTKERIKTIKKQN